MAVPRKSRNAPESVQERGNDESEPGVSPCQANILGHFIWLILCLVWGVLEDLEGGNP